MHLMASVQFNAGDPALLEVSGCLDGRAELGAWLNSSGIFIACGLSLSGYGRRRMGAPLNSDSDSLSGYGPYGRVVGAPDVYD